MRNTDNIHQRRWMDSEGGKLTMMCIKEISPTVIRANMDFSRYKVGISVNILTGHYLNKPVYLHHLQCKDSA